MYEFADDDRTELDRKAGQLKWTALVETAGYFVLFYCFAIWKNVAATKMTGFFHGWIFIAYAVMVAWIYPSIEWKWWWIPLSLLTGPLGGILLFEKIRREGAPPRVTPTRFERWNHSRPAVRAPASTTSSTT
jgi:hypothetical protein